jgi:hypothetical protein
MGTDRVVQPAGVNHCAENSKVWALIECGLVLTKQGALAVQGGHATGSKRNYFITRHRFSEEQCNNSYNKRQSCTNSQLYFGKELYMFRTDPLSIISSLNTVFTAIGICHTSYVDCLLAIVILVIPT